MDRTILDADIFLVVNKTVLHDSDHKILTMLYQPIIGSTAINLYLTLWSYLDKTEVISSNWTHHHLVKSMQVGMEQIVAAREKLEAIGLIKTYYKEGDINSYIYELYSPLRVSDFLNDTILATILYDTIGKDEFNEIVEYYRLPSLDLSGYKDISSKFSDIFMTTSIVNLEQVKEIKQRNVLGISYEPTIDLNSILSLIPSEMLNIRSVTKNVKDLIYKLALVYNFDNDDMKSIIMDSIGTDHKIDIDKLKQRARSYYKFENGGKTTELVYKNQPEYLRTKLTSTSKKARQIYVFETMSPYDFLASKNKCEPSKQELEILDYLLVEANLQPGVVNVLIDYVLNISDNKLVPKFIENKAVEWKRNNIETVEDAMSQARKEKNSKKSPTKKVSSVAKTEWFDKNIESEKASIEEQQAFREMLKNME